MKEIQDVKPFTDELQIVHLPKARIIGKYVRNGGSLGNTAPILWDEIYSSDQHTVLENLPQIVSKDLFGWTLEYEPSTQTFLYIVCALTPTQTPVPNGYIFRDIPDGICAVGLYGESVKQTLKRAALQGFEENWNANGFGWNAEMYFNEEEQNPRRISKTPWHWLVPVRLIQK